MIGGQTDKESYLYWDREKDRLIKREILIEYEEEKRDWECEWRERG